MNSKNTILRFWGEILQDSTFFCRNKNGLK
nr:MAG TPA: hypothetical protein [Caudoviricetes sp.]